MAITIVPSTLTIECTESILDLPSFHSMLRDWEFGEVGMLYPVTHIWKALPLGGGAFFYGMELSNGWKIHFSAPGNYIIQGNLTGTVTAVSGVFLERRTSAAFTTTSTGGGVTPQDVAEAVWSYTV